MMKNDFETSYLFGANAPFIEELYDAYLQDPSSVSAEWKVWFDQLGETTGNLTRDISHQPTIQHFEALAKRGPAPVTQGDPEQHRKQTAVLQFINAHRFLGSRVADLDPLHRRDPGHVPELDLAYYGLSEADLDNVYNTGSLVGPDRASLREIVQAVRSTYCGHIGIEYMYVTVTEQKRWIQQRFESLRSKPEWDVKTREWLLEQITAAETLEKYLHTRYVGQKRFSLEGGESMIPVINDLIRQSGSQGMQEIVIGMAHRGRLNMLVNCLGKLPSDLFSEFEGKHPSELSSGDVKYHQGFSSDVQTPGGPVHLTLKS
jgi:2-oxoglutarate dehydrogenase E1 component